MLGRVDPRKPLSIDAEAAANFAKLGVTVEVEEETNNEVPVWAPNWPALLLFLDCETQWLTVGTMSGVLYTGLNYVAVFGLMRLRGFPDDAFDGLQVIEGEALGILNERK